MSEKSKLHLVGKAILYATVQIGFANLNLSSRFDLKHPSTDQQTLQNTSDSLEDYIKISLLWTIGVVLLFYEEYGWLGVWLSLTCNIAIILWMYFSYISVMDHVAKKYGLEYTKPFQ